MKLGALIPQLHVVSREMAIQERNRAIQQREDNYQAMMKARVNGDLVRNVKLSFADKLMEGLWKLVPCNTCTHVTACRVANHGGTIDIAAIYCKVKQL